MEFASIKLKWFEVVRSTALLYKEESYTILIGDGVKQAKEGKHMPCVKKIFQESKNSSKPEYIFGHMFSGIGVLAGSLSKWFCIPLHIKSARWYSDHTLLEYEERTFQNSCGPND